MRTPKDFVLTSDHVKLLKAAEWRWADYETGAPEIDGKRPYGNSYVAGDIAEILGWPVDPEEGPTREQENRALEIHNETLFAIREIVARFELTGAGVVMTTHRDSTGSGEQ